ncbi:hypothetical protein [Pseudomonas alabamensis]|uniref:hypothetical protein n=1 Tax=Pseudomonas alabamensis TaxID=3064349 RepID=UPI0011A7C63E
MLHHKNITEFKAGFNCGSALLESYCRMIAIELKLANIAPLKNHNIILKLQNLSKSSAGLPAATALNARISELTSAFNDIQVESIKGTKSLPLGSYPHIRYVRITGDWATNHTNMSKIAHLNEKIKSTIITLKQIGHSI